MELMEFKERAGRLDVLFGDKDVSPEKAFEDWASQSLPIELTLNSEVVGSFIEATVGADGYVYFAGGIKEECRGYYFGVQLDDENYDSVAWVFIP